MPLDTGTFVAGVGVLVSLDLAVLGISVQNARKVGTDPKARQRARDAYQQARKAQASARTDGGGVDDDA